MLHKPPHAAAIYARISHDPSGERLGVQRQEADCHDEAARRGWKVVDAYVDDDLSAFKARRRRPQYQRLLADISAGARDGVMIWRLDRLHRQPRELEEFIVLCDQQRVSLATVTGDVDLSTSQGRLLARTWGAFAAHESEIKSERIQRALLERARSGRPNGGGRNRPYGYERDQETVVSAEATVIKEAVARVLAGDPLNAICRDLDRRRIRTVCGHVWQPVVLSQVLTSHRIAGQRAYNGEVVAKATWKAIITPAVSARVRAVLLDPRRRTNGGAQVLQKNQLLAGLMRCGLCGEVLVNRRRGRRRIYACVTNGGIGLGCGRLSITAGEVEDLLFERLCERLESQRARTWLAEAHLADPDWSEARLKLAAAEQQLEELAMEFAAGRLAEVEWRVLRPRLLEQLSKATTALRNDSGEGAAGEFIGNSAALRVAWESMPMQRRQLIARAVIEYIDVRPRAGLRRFQPSRVQIRWKGDAHRNRFQTRSSRRDPPERGRVRGSAKSELRVLEALRVLDETRPTLTELAEWLQKRHKLGKPPSLTGVRIPLRNLEYAGLVYFDRGYRLKERGRS